MSLPLFNKSSATAPNGDLVSSIISAARAIKIQISRGNTISTKLLLAAMERATGADSASGVWTRKDAYEALEIAQILYVIDNPRRLSTFFDDPLPIVMTLAEMSSRLPTQSVRSEEQISLDQFSTPFELSALVSLAADIRHTDTVIEPSAGTGMLAAFPQALGATLKLNEFSDNRQALLKAVFPKATHSKEDARVLESIIGANAADVAIMNPPFTDIETHITQAFETLKPGGRLVAIVPERILSSELAETSAERKYTVSARILFHDASFKKHGVAISIGLLVVDKKEPSSSVTPIERVNSLVDCVRTIQNLPPRPEIDERATGTGAILAQLARAKPGLKVNARFDPPIDAIPVEYEPIEVLADDDVDIYSAYRPSSARVKGARPHITPLVESASMAAISMPKPIAAPTLPPDLVTKGILSESQLEAISCAESAHESFLGGKFRPMKKQPWVLEKVAETENDGHVYRQGFMIGDGTGAGKGREASGIILSALSQGHRKAVWASMNQNLIVDAKRDWDDLGMNPDDIVPQNRWKTGTQIGLDAGILFTTYPLLRQAGRNGLPSRLDQLIEWLGEDFDGVIILDESHHLGGAEGSTSNRGAKAASQQGRAILELQNRLPLARIVYSSATGATEPTALAYTTRLGLWSFLNAPFANRTQFVQAMEHGGIAAMEVVARDLKAMGLYISRNLSFDGVEYEPLIHKLTDQNLKAWNPWADAFQIIHQNLSAAMAATNITDRDSGATNDARVKSAVRSRFESLKQRFFAHLLLAIKTPSMITQIEQDLKDDMSCVIQVISTNEALMERRLAEIDPSEWNDLVTSFSPREYVLDYLKHAFPVNQFTVHSDGENTTIHQTTDSNGNPLLNPRAVQMRDELIESLCSLPDLPNCLDQILHHFGADQVAEVTGRSRRIVKKDGRLKVERRPASSNQDEISAFQNGEKRILIFSQAGGTGASYHADQNAPNTQRRAHYLAEPGWRPDNAIQGLGRTHRSNQLQPPLIRPVTTTIRGEKRFTSSISKRLDTLGALTRGERKTGGQGLFDPADNLEGSIAKAALRQFYIQLFHGRLRISLTDFMKKTALNLVSEQEGCLLESLPAMHTFLNRILALRIEDQNIIFEELEKLIAQRTEAERAAGTLDLGIEEIADSSAKLISHQLLRTCPTTGGKTYAVEFTIEQIREVIELRDVANFGLSEKLMMNKKSGLVALIDMNGGWFSKDDDMVPSVILKRPNGRQRILLEEFNHEGWEQINWPAFAQAWTQQLSTIPRTQTITYYMITGLLLPIWNNLGTESVRVRRITFDGNTYLGRVVTPSIMATLKKIYNPDLDIKMGSATIANALLEENETFSSPSGIRLKRSLVAGKYRIEVVTNDASHQQACLDRGCYAETIQYVRRLFVPAQNLNDVLQRILDYAPMTPVIAKAA